MLGYVKVLLDADCSTMRLDEVLYINPGSSVSNGLGQEMLHIAHDPIRL